ncbi:hypothetical protein FEK35_10875 [Nocardia cyriacigeorgica]|uniref:Uncharacterized protein n=1 Tax=Nocardia cyriacigeorgica TaxID=135487 RepID=A0A5R8PFJ6_9NOCA|nr:hypothetical protein [Nocardia cyriacigeorgica]TLG12411.1 hypothetical protein FEK35_10875 [Nocardia cyriacigeorgica]
MGAAGELTDDYYRVDELVQATTNLLSQMELSDGEKRTLSNLVAENFRGEGGESQAQFQARFDNLVNEYNTALKGLKGAVGQVGGSGGEMHITDKGLRGLFDGILG